VAGDQAAVVRKAINDTMPTGGGVQRGGIGAVFGDERRGRVELIWVGVGGFAGANARYVMGREMESRFGDGFPHGTLAINVLGSLVIGVLVTMLAERFAPSHAVRLLLVTGFLGGYTTFSSYAFEAITLADRGQVGRALIYVLASNGLALAACAAGIALMRGLR